MLKLHGVVVWKSPRSEIALIWCDDGGPLVLAEDMARICLRGVLPRAGDLVEVVCAEDAMLRPCISVGVLATAAVSDPVQALRHGVSEIALSQQTDARRVPHLRLVSSPAEGGEMAPPPTVRARGVSSAASPAADVA